MEPSTYQRASDLLQTASTEEAGGDRAAALQHVQEGLDVIGDSYQSEDTLDDTGMRLVLSTAEEKKGNLETALRLRRAVLENRLLLLKNKESAKP